MILQRKELDAKNSNVNIGLLRVDGGKQADITKVYDSTEDTVMRRKRLSKLGLVRFSRIRQRMR